jgi:methionyl-tRNA synthetase
MEVMNCRTCKKLFNYISGPYICPACRDELEKKFLEVKKFIRENPNKNISEVSEEMDVSVQQLKTWVRQERLVFSEDSKVMIECEQCGASIRTGRFCDKCKKNLALGLEQLYPKETAANKKGHETDKMRHF